MRKNLFLILFIVVLILSVCHATDIKAALKDHDWDFGTTITKTESRITYSAYPSRNGKEAWIYHISYKFAPKTLSIPESIDGRKVTRIGDPHGLAEKYPDERKNILSVMVEFWTNEKVYPNSIKKVILPNTLEVMEPCTFGDFHGIETIKIPPGITKIGEYTFYRCKRLKKVILPENLRELDPLAFNKCPNLKKLKLSPQNKFFKIKSGKFLIARKNNALVFAAADGPGLHKTGSDRLSVQAGYRVKTLKIPNGIKIIKQNACNNVTASVVHIPASVLKLEKNVFTSRDIKDVTVAGNNKVFRKDGQCIYRIKDKSLAVAIVDENRNLRVSENVEKITTEYNMVNYDRQDYDDYLQNVLFPGNLKSVRYPGFDEVANAKNVYFTGITPPKLTVPKKNKQMVSAKLPILCNLYVPKDSVEAYEAWYQKYGLKDAVKWYAYDGDIPDITNITDQAGFGKGAVYPDAPGSGWADAAKNPNGMEDGEKEMVPKEK